MTVIPRPPQKVGAVLKREAQLRVPGIVAEELERKNGEHPFAEWKRFSDRFGMWVVGSNAVPIQHVQHDVTQRVHGLPCHYRTLLSLCPGLDNATHHVILQSPQWWQALFGPTTGRMLHAIGSFLPLCLSLRYETSSWKNSLWNNARKWGLLPIVSKAVRQVKTHLCQLSPNHSLFLESLNWYTPFPNTTTTPHAVSYPYATPEFALIVPFDVWCILFSFATPQSRCAIALSSFCVYARPLVCLP